MILTTQPPPHRSPPAPKTVSGCMRLWISVDGSSLLHSHFKWWLEQLTPQTTNETNTLFSGCFWSHTNWYWFSTAGPSERYESPELLLAGQVVVALQVQLLSLSNKLCFYKLLPKHANINFFPSSSWAVLGNWWHSAGDGVCFSVPNVVGGLKMLALFTPLSSSTAHCAV